LSAAPAGEALTILTLNSGSSSLKFELFQVSPDHADSLIAGEVKAIGEAKSRFSASEPGKGREVSETTKISSQAEAAKRIFHLLRDWAAPKAAAVGHRVVHGGPRLREHCRINDGVIALLKDASAFAPLHDAGALDVIALARAAFPSAVQIACFDTAFHAGMPDVARVLPLPRALLAEGVHRYGFHGLSCESIVRQLAGALPERLVIAHLGAGASVTAVKAGRSIDTSMGLTPTGGVMMATRSGDLDPGVLLYLMREKQLDAAALEDLVDHRSGLLGVSGLSDEMESLLAAPTNPDARLAVEMFAYQTRKTIAAMSAALGGLDLIVFTGGIGEKDVEARAAVCRELAWMGVELDDEANRASSNPISRPSSRCAVQVLPSRENEEIAWHTYKLTA
jgi:acetate kinase